jgi:hypothetical protein
MNTKDLASLATVTKRNEQLLSSGTKLGARNGKTAKDHASGAIHKNANNKAKRAAWENGIEKSFPTDTCSGKRHRPASFKKPRNKTRTRK